MKIRVFKSACALIFVLSVSFTAWAADTPASNSPASNSKVVITKVLSTTQTSSGQPIKLPQSDVQVIVTTLEIHPGATLPRHLHPYPRYGYVMQGTLKITNEVTGLAETYKAGDFIVESLNQWHHAEIVGDEPVKLLVIDQVEGRRADNTVAGK